jgi:acyl carrier protein
MADRSDVAKRVIKVVCEVLGVEASEVSEASRFVTDLGAESIQSIELVAAFEEEFDIEMDEDAALKVESVGLAVDFILKHVEAKKG